MKRSASILAVMAVLLLPCCALANAIIPQITAYRDTPVFHVLFVAVVLVESLCARLWLRRMHFASVLWRVALINAASSLAGYLFVRSPWRSDSSYVWIQAIPFFFLTVCVELPLFGLLLRRASSSWRRRLMAGLGMNVVSYALIVVAEGPIEYTWLDRLYEDDRRVVETWNRPAMLAECAGVIYGTESPPGSSDHRLRYFSPRESTWHALTKCPPIDPLLWDVEGDLAALGYGQADGPPAFKRVVVLRLPGFEPVSELQITNTIKNLSRWELRISPNRTMLAVLVPLHAPSAPLPGSSIRYFGMIYELRVYDIVSGRLVAVSPRRAARGVCWSPDSRQVLFASLRRDDLHELTDLGKEWKRDHPDVDKLFSDIAMYAFDIESGAVAYFGEMDSAHVAPQAGAVVYKHGPDRVDVLDLHTGATNRVQVGALGIGDLAVSPDGRHAVVHLRLKHPLAYHGYPAIVDLADPSRRQFIDTFNYSLDWTTDEGAR